MKNIFIIAIAIIFLLTGCGGKEIANSETEAVQYLLNVVNKTPDTQDTLDLLPDIEDIIIQYAKNTLFESAYKILIPDDGYVMYESASSFATTIASLSAICSGKTSLFRDDKLLYTFESNSKENAYQLLGNKIAMHIFDHKYTNGTFNDMYLKGSVLVAEFSIEPSNFDNIIADKDIYKYLDLTVSIIDKQYTTK